MQRFDLNPSEEIYEIEFEGSFIPQKFTPFWFHNNGLLGKTEAENATIIKVEKGEILIFSTKFIRIIVQKERFTIGTAQLLSLDLVKDMAISIADILKDALTDKFSYNLRLHISFKNEKKLKQALNSICNVERWEGILSNPQSNSFHVIEKIKSNETKLERNIFVSLCGKKNMENTLHLYVYNVFDLSDKKQSLSTVVMNNSNVFSESIVLMNKLINLHFTTQ